MRRLPLGVVLSLSAVALLVSPTASASPLAEAQDRARTLRSQLQAATSSLEAAEAALYETEDVLAFDRRQVQSARSQRTSALRSWPATSRPCTAPAAWPWRMPCWTAIPR